MPTDRTRNNLPALLCCLFAAVLVLSGCGGRRIELLPPGISLVQLVALPEGSAIDIQLRLENHSEIELMVETLELELKIDQVSLQTRPLNQISRVAKLSNEVLRIAADYDAVLIEKLDLLSQGKQQRLPIGIQGYLITDTGKRLEIDEDSWLNATPGKPGHFR